MNSGRHTLTKFLVILATLMGVTSVTAQTPLKKVRIVVGTGSLNISYPTLNLPVALGYWKQEGYDVEVTPLAPPAQSVALLVAGQGDFAQLNASAAIQAQSLNNQPVKFVMAGGVIDWSVGVLSDSPYKAITELKGKTIGVFGLGSGGVAILRSYLLERGIDPDKDVTIVATGGGAPAMDALRSGRVQALMYWASAMASFENGGLKLRYLRGEDWRKMPDFTLATMSKTLESDPKMVEAIARGMAKATVFAQTNPECVRKIQWKAFPSTKPTGNVDEATLVRWDLNILKAQLDSFNDAFLLNGGKLYGNVDPGPIDALQNFMIKSKQIQRQVPVNAFLVSDAGFFQRVNNFDVAEIKAAATACANW